MSSIDEKLDRVVRRHEELQHLLSGEVSDPRAFAAMSKELSDLGPIVERIQALFGARAQMAEAEQMMADPEMKDLAAEEYYDLKERVPELEQELRLLMLPKDAADEKNAILEVRAGTGGDEASLFAGELFRMYERFAQSRGWRFETLEVADNEVGGVKEAVARISGAHVFRHLKFESGVHRVQRVPVTESGGRIHTSAATVAVLPEAEDVDIHIEDKDLRVDTYRSQGAGGQHVNTTDSAVRITHVPTGVVAACQDEKSQHKNRAKAMTILRSRIYEEERRKADAERAESRKSQVGSGDRSERIRTYNFPQGRVTDHRINLTLHNLDKVIEGPALDEVVQALIAEDQAAKLADQG